MFNCGILYGQSQQGGNNDSCKKCNSFKQITDARMILHSKLVKQNIDKKINLLFILNYIFHFSRES